MHQQYGQPGFGGEPIKPISNSTYDIFVHVIVILSQIKTSTPPTAPWGQDVSLWGVVRLIGYYS